jgi:hypothetical protein
LIKFLGESIVQHYRLSSLEMSSGEVLYLSGAFNHCQENLNIDSPRNFINACLLAATARNLFQSGIGLPSMKLSHFRT